MMMIIYKFQVRIYVGNRPLNIKLEGIYIYCSFFLLLKIKITYYLQECINLKKKNQRQAV